MHLESSKTGRFITMSFAAHVGVALTMALISIPLVEQIKTENLTIEIMEPVRVLSKGDNLPVATTPPPPAALPTKIVKEAPPVVSAPRPTLVAASPRAAVKPAATKTAKHRGAHAPIPAPAISARRAVVQAPPSAPPRVATIDDIDAPDIEQSTQQTKTSWTPTTLNESFADEELEKVDEKQAGTVAAVHSPLIQEADDIDTENEQALSEAQAEVLAQKEKLAAANEARRNQDKQAIAAAAAQESLAAERAAAARQAAQQQVLAQATAKAQAEASAGGAGAGVPEGVRSLDQLRQIPGNPVPNYSQAERLKRQQGQVTYVAYVRRDGSLTRFRQVSTTGFANLDAKTLQALEQWKFYPGQEGWVELPFRWDLKGGPQAIDGLLRGVKRSDAEQSSL